MRARARGVALVIAAIACVAIACAEPPTPERLRPMERTAERDARALRARWVGEPTGGGPLVVLLHGYGAPGDDLVPLAEVLAARLDGRARFALPEAPLARPGGGRAWWRIDDLGARPADRGADVPAGLAEARRDVIAWLESERSAGRLAPERTVLAGFSQGAMLAADVALAWEHRVAGVAMLSGAPVDEERWRERMRARTPPPFFLSHGRQDPLLAFSAAGRLRRTLEEAGADVAFVPFDGGHTIPPPVVDAVPAFLRRVAAR